jgi:hypothetical protein
MNETIITDVKNLIEKIKKDWMEIYKYSPDLSEQTFHLVPRLEKYVKCFEKEGIVGKRREKKFNNMINSMNVNESNIRKVIANTLSYYKREHYNDKRKDGWRIKAYGLSHEEIKTIAIMLKPFLNISMTYEKDAQVDNIVLITMKEVEA